ncbi:MAG: PQQ-binding-like beta-propeller repeat protein [Bauldia sp.]|nr:PQQ-binding-like beta-propeller repeat protein [Bauldia sp.]
MKRGLATVSAIALSSVLGMVGPAFGQATQERLNNADSEPENWLIPFQNYSSHRYSRLDEINRDNVGNLKVAFAFSLDDPLRGDNNDNESPILVDNGIAWVEAHSGMLYRLDLTSGNDAVLVWKADSGIDPEEGTRTRGFAMYEDSLIQNLQDGRVLRVDRDSGEIIWDMQIARAESEGHSGVNLQEEGFASNPLVANGIIQVGNSAGDAGTRGWVAGVDFETGEEVWRFYTVPGPGEPGHETWEDDHEAWRTGGAAIWTGWSFDVEQDQFIGGTAQPVPMFDPEFRPGDNLFSNSAMALDRATGDLAWYFQYTPNESWDYDEQGVHMLIDAPFSGPDIPEANRKMVLHFARNGYVYLLDRTNGTFLTATQYVEDINWTAGIDPKTGLPVEYDPNLALQTYIPETRWARADTAAKSVCPTHRGGTRWQPPSYNPDTFTAYIGSEDGCTTIDRIVPSLTLADGGIDEQGRYTSRVVDIHGNIAAVDVRTGELLNRISTLAQNESGALDTAGGVLFTALLDGTFKAYHDETLEELYSFNTGIGIKAPPTSFAIDGKQYVAVIAGSTSIEPDGSEVTSGSMLFVFTL